MTVIGSSTIIYDGTGVARRICANVLGADSDCSFGAASKASQPVTKVALPDSKPASDSSSIGQLIKILNHAATTKKHTQGKPSL